MNTFYKENLGVVGDFRLGMNIEPGLKVKAFFFLQFGILVYKHPNINSIQFKQKGMY